MSDEAQFQTAFQAARSLHAQGRLAVAERSYKQLLIYNRHRETVLQALTDVYLQGRRPKFAVQVLTELAREVPERFLYRAQLASLLDELGQTDAAIAQYQDFLRRQPEHADAHFNLALLLKKAFRYSDAIAAYDSAIRLGIGNVQEVYSNLGVLYSDMRNSKQALQMYDKSLATDSHYIPALFNLASLQEELGDRDKACATYNRILELDPRQWESLARLAQAVRIDDPDDTMITRLEAAIEQARDEPLDCEGLLFALGKVLDGCGQYERAFDAFTRANRLGKQRNPPYRREATERAFDDLTSLFDADWLARTTTALDEAPVFVCGMFRSGSTLAEQMLGRHPALTAGGELDFMPWMLARRLAPYPRRAATATVAQLQAVAAEYTTRVRELYPEADRVTDKRPDNFLHLGIIGAMFPAARFVHTVRNVDDNCLSMYFQQFGGNLLYATDLDDTRHYYAQHQRLMAHWQTLLGERIFTLDYDALVRDPELTVRDLLTFLDLDWDPACLEFRNADTAVKTASVWQVREGLHTASSGRWKNYAPYINKPVA